MIIIIIIIIIFFCIKKSIPKLSFESYYIIWRDCYSVL